MAWLNDLEVTYFLTHEFPAAATLESELAWLARKRAPECGDRVWTIEVEGEAIGVCELHAESMGPTAAFGIIIGEKTAWGKGYGTAATREVVRIGFEEMGLERIWLTASSVNPRGVRCYEKVGFRHEGVLRRARWKRGEWIDVINMGLLRSEFEASQKAKVKRQKDGQETCDM